MKNLKRVVLLLFFMINYSGANAQVPGVMLSDKSGWHKIGETTVNFKTETDKILILGMTRFSAIRIKVTDAPVNLKELEIHFTKGEVQNVAIGEDIKAAGESRVIDLEGKGERIIRKVVFRYNTAVNHDGQHAHMELWGLKTKK